jgi:hypothetical protein
MIKLLGAQRHLTYEVGLLNGLQILLQMRSQTLLLNGLKPQNDSFLITS